MRRGLSFMRFFHFDVRCWKPATLSGYDVNVHLSRLTSPLHKIQQSNNPSILARFSKSVRHYSCYYCFRSVNTNSGIGFRTFGAGLPHAPEPERQYDDRLIGRVKTTSQSRVSPLAPRIPCLPGQFFFRQLSMIGTTLPPADNVSLQEDLSLVLVLVHAQAGVIVVVIHQRGIRG